MDPAPAMEDDLDDSDTTGGAPIESSETEVAAVRSTKVPKRWLHNAIGMVIPLLTTGDGRIKMSTGKSLIVILCLYLSHSLSAWGDRMWAFAVSLLLAFLYPGSLLLPGLHGFLMQLFVAIFGTAIGDWVDFNPRMKVAAVSLIVQNGLLFFSSVAMALMFYFQWNVCLNVVVFGVLVVLVIVLTSGANLATVANTISIEKDWIVVIGDGNKDTLAILNANMRRIDLCCKLLAPALTGVILQHAGPFVTTVVVAIWNIFSFFGELGLLLIVYKLIPPLAVKKLRDFSSVYQDNKENKKLPKDDSFDTEDNSFDTDNETLLKENEKEEEIVLGGDDIKIATGKRIVKKLFSFILTFKNGWKIYIHQEIALVGFSMASIYLTVLGFSGVTSSYFLTQGLRSDLIGVFQGIGAILGVTGTVIYPFLRKKVGTVRTGLFGISTQLLILLFCIGAVVVPSNNTSSRAVGYYSPDCSSFINESNSDMKSSVVGVISSAHATICVSQSSPNPSLTVLSSQSCQPNSSTTPNSETNHVSIAVILMLTGVVGCRIGLWVFDLAVQQLVQEKVIEEERGVVGGVMNAMNSVMDMLHYVLVIVAPRPEHFNVLTVISFIMVSLGWLLYSIYVRKSRGHFFHFRDCLKLIRKKKLCC